MNKKIVFLLFFIVTLLISGYSYINPCRPYDPILLEEGKYHEEQPWKYAQVPATDCMKNLDNWKTPETLNYTNYAHIYPEVPLISYTIPSNTTIDARNHPAWNNAKYVSISIVSYESEIFNHYIHYAFWDNLVSYYPYIYKFVIQIFPNPYDLSPLEYLDVEYEKREAIKLLYYENIDQVRWSYMGHESYKLCLIEPNVDSCEFWKLRYLYNFHRKDQREYENMMIGNIPSIKILNEPLWYHTFDEEVITYYVSHNNKLYRIWLEGPGFIGCDCGDRGVISQASRELFDIFINNIQFLE